MDSKRRSIQIDKNNDPKKHHVVDMKVDFLKKLKNLVT